MALHVDFEAHELEGKSVICAADQDPFELGHNVFCVLTPLLLEDGRRFDQLKETFPNRGRVWWMVRHDLNAAAITPGCLCEVKLERAVDYDSGRPDKDFYQARRRDATIGVKAHFEVITLDHEPKLGELLRPGGVPHHCQPTQRVMVAGPKNIVGPFHAEWSAKTRTATLRAINPGSPVVWQIKKAQLPEDALQEFKLTANQWCKHETSRELLVAIFHSKFLEHMESNGTALDAADDNQVLNWGLKLIEMSNREAKEIKDLLERVQTIEVGDNEPAGRLTRFLAICQSGQRIMQLNEQVATSISAQPAFADLVKSNLEKITQARVEAEVQLRRKEIEEQVADTNEKLQRLNVDLGQLQQEYQRKDSDLAKEFQQEHERRIADLTGREAKVAEMEQQVDRWQQEMEARLEKIAGTYRNDLSHVTDELLTHLPLWRRLGLLGDSSEQTAVQTRPRTPILPGFLAHDREKGNLSESEFIDQFADVTRHRGFVFDRDDLINFHVSVKSGFWTILAGPSGTGKSSLPRCYSEALGTADEQLWVPVRPDWVDDRDVFGGFNSFLNRFEPSATGIVDRMIAALEDMRKNRGGIYLLCLDEMNIARVEHYFATLLSVSEQPADRRIVELFARGIASPDDPYAPYRSLQIADNIRIVGTVNIDESSHFFSPKVLDRASVLVLEEPDLAAAVALPEGTRPGGLAPVHYEEYAAWTATPVIDDIVREFVVRLSAELKNYGAGLGHRTIKRILTYVGSANSLLTEERALDFAFSQMILPRLKASSPRYRQLLARLKELLPEARFPRTSRLVETLLQTEGEYDFFQVL